MSAEEFEGLPELPSWGVGLSRESLWRVHAACSGLPTDPFFEERGGQARDAEMVCASCPVRLDCLQEAVLGPWMMYEFGIWGGASERWRRVLRRELAQSPHEGRFYGPVGCPCRFCAALGELGDRLAALKRDERPPVLDGVAGTGRSHGKAATYAAGCRCEPCRAAMRSQRDRRRATLEAERQEQELAEDPGAA